MSRYCFRLRVDPTRIPEYRRRHAAVWPDMLRALRDAGWRDYWLFLDEDGLVIGVFESERSFGEAEEAMARTEANRAWQDFMAPLFQGAGPDDGLRVLEPVFHLETQLAALGET